MALTPEIIKANEALADLSEDHIAAIATLSTNDEEATISKRISNLHEAHDKNILEISGIEKEDPTEESYKYTRRVLSTFKEKASASEVLPTKVSELEKKIAEYEKQLASGSTDKALVQRLADTEDTLNRTKQELEVTRKQVTENESVYKKALREKEVSSDFKNVTSSLKIKKEFAVVAPKLIKTAEKELLESYVPDYVEENGEQTLVWRDKDGAIVRTKENGLKATTTEELMRKQLSEILDTSTISKGAGTSPLAPGASSTVLDVTSHKTQVEADKAIFKYLMDQGLTRGSREFAEEQTRIRIENKVDKLPVR